MTRKAIGVAALLAAFVLSVSIPAQGQGPYGQSPSIAKKKKTKLKKGKLKVAKVTCGTGTCQVTRSRAKIIAGGKKFKTKFTKGSKAPIGPGQSVVAAVVVKKAAKRAILAVGKDKVKWGLGVTGSDGLGAGTKGKTRIKSR